MKRVLTLLFVLLVVLSFYPTCCYAAESQGFPFAVEMISPTNQIGTVGYYHVPGEPGEQITLMAKLTNLTSQSLEIKVVSLNAYSSQDGIFYQSPLEVNLQVYALVDGKYGIAQYMTGMDPTTLLPNQTEVVSFSVAVPYLNIGSLLGGIRFVVFEGTQALQIADKQNGNAQILLDKYQAIDTAIQIDLPQKVKSSIAVGDPTFYADKIDVSMWIINQAAIIQENISGTYEIRDKENIVLFNGIIKAFKMSPMAKFQYPMSWQYKTLEEGTYTLSLKLNVNGEEIIFDKPFVIDKQDVTEAQQAQEKINPEIKARYPLWFWFVIGLFIIVIIIILIKYLRLKRLGNRKK